MSRFLLSLLQSSALIVAGMCASVSVFAEQPQLTPSGPADPMRCWWRTSSSALHVGEIASVTLTCSVLETTATKVVPDETRLDATALQMAPFEVVGGVHPADMRTRDHRFFQYGYSVRLIDDKAIGREVQLPSIRIPYRIEVRDSGGNPQQGREQVYALPSATIRIVSLVPADAADIRVPAPAGFGDVEGRESRADQIRVVGGVLYGLAALSGLLTLARVAKQYRAKKPADTARLVPDAVVLREVRRELDRAMHDRTVNGWTPEVAGRTLSLFRIGASYAAGEAVSQKRLSGVTQSDRGALLLKPSRWGRETDRLSVSAAATPERLGQRERSANDAQRLDAELVAQFQRVLRDLTRARYGRPGSLDESALDEAMETGRRLVDTLVSEHRPVVRGLRSVSFRIRHLGWRV